MTELLDLPSELISNVFQHLEDADFFATRLASKTPETSAVTLFGRRFFRKKGYMITDPSLDVLKAVSNSSKLSKYVQHVWFNPDCYTFITPACAPEPDIICDDAEDEDDEEMIEITERVDLLSEENKRRWRAYIRILGDHESLLQDEALLLQARLEDILPNLPNLRIMGMRRSEDHSPWGWRRLKDAIGEDPRVLGEIPSQTSRTLSESTRLFNGMLTAIASTGIRLQRLYTDAVEVDNIPKHWMRETKLQRALQHVLYLEINVSKANLPLVSPQWNYRALREEADCGDGLLQVFRAVAPTLLELGLQIFPEMRTHLQPRGPPPYEDYVLRHWSYQCLTFLKVVENVRFENLTRLKLEKIVATPETLKAFLVPSSRHLTSLKMRDVRLFYRAGDDYLPWGWIFAFLHSSIPNLSYLLLYQLLYVEGGISFADPKTLGNAQGAGHFTTQLTNDPNDFPDDLDTLLPTDGSVQGGTFREYRDVTREARGRGEVVTVLEEIKDRHWYCGDMYSFAMDDEVWHTDTSDEEW